MKILKKTLLVLAVIIFLALIAGIFIIKHIATKGLPDYSQNILLKGMQQEVTVYRDSSGIPHIYAKNEGDLYRAVGYLTAQDRLWQMDLLRRATTGKLSEIFGEDFIKSDMILRSLRIPDKSKMVLDSLTKGQISALTAFSDGVNQFIDTHLDKLPPEFTILGYTPEKWLPEHSSNLIGYMAWDLAAGWSEKVVLDQLKSKIPENKLNDLIPDLSLEKSVVFPQTSSLKNNYTFFKDLLAHSQQIEDLGLTVFNGSNNWAVSGKKSITGKPILANDMHLNIERAPGIWYQIHEVVEGKLDVTGVLLPGQPFVICGHNQRIAWGMTNVYTEDIDFYRETINPENPNQYKFNGEWKNLEVRKEKIRIKGGKEIEKELRFTHRGPLVSEFKDVKDVSYSMHWMGNEFSNELRTVFMLNRAGNWEEFKNAINTFRSVSQNIVYADIDGNIGLYCAAGAPIRKDNGFPIHSGETGEFDWKGIVPFDSLPHIYNPECGFVCSANNRTAPDNYRFFIGRWYDLPYRYDRIKEMLQAKDKLSIEDFKQMQADQKSKFVEEIKPFILEALKDSKDQDDLEKQCLDILKSWDNVMNKDLVAPSIFDQFVINLNKNIFMDELVEDQFKLTSSLYKFVIDKIIKGKESDWCDDVNTKEIKENFSDMIRKSFKDAVITLTTNFGNNPDKWVWGKIHTLTLKHPMGKVKILDALFNMNRGPFPVGGSKYTVSPYTYSLITPYHVFHGSSHRHIYSLANWDDSQTIIPTGESGIPASEYYCDQTKLYVNNVYHSDFISIEKIQKSAEYKITIK